MDFEKIIQQRDIDAELMKGVSRGLSFENYAASVGAPASLKTRYEQLSIEKRAGGYPEYRAREYKKLANQTGDPVTNAINSGIEKGLTFAEYRTLTGCPRSLEGQYNSMKEKASAASGARNKFDKSDSFIQGFDADASTPMQQKKPRKYCYSSTSKGI